MHVDEDESKRRTIWTDSSGLIKSVDLFNFMCHTRLTMKFDPKMNFVIGHNGSGKSAIISAIMVCLGGKASNTDRGNSVRHLIKIGCSSAKVVVQLSNEGINAYHSEIFGDTIIVERTISNSAGSAYRIKDSAGHVKFTKRDYLNNILDFFMIDVENQLIVLTQKTAKAFIQQTTPRAKYDFFMEGTYLYRIALDTSKVQERLVEADKISTLKKSELKLLKQEVKNYREQLTYFRRRDELENKLQQLNFEQIWLYVEKLEKKLSEEIAKRDRTNLKSQKAAEKELEQQRKLDEINTEFDKVSGTQASLEEELEVPRAQHLAHQVQLRGIEQETEQLERDLRLNQNEIQFQRQNLQKLEKKIALEEQKLQADEMDFQSKMNAELAGIRHQIAELEDRARELEQSKQGLLEKQASLKNEIRLAADSREQNRRSLLELKEAVRDLEQSQTNKLLVYGANMPRVLEEIDAIAQRGGWAGDPPLGPIGNYISLRDAKWQSTVENLIGRLLCSFIVSKNQDRERLNKILRGNRVDAQIYYVDCPKDFAQRLSNGEPDRKFLTVRRVLEIRHPLAECALVINNHIEKIILIETHDEADQVMASGADGKPPENVLACYTIDGFSVGHAGGGFSTQVLRKRTQGASKLVTDVTAEIRRQKAALIEIETAHKNAEQRHEVLCNLLRDCSNQMQGLEQRLHKSNGLIREQKRHEERHMNNLAAHQPVDLSELIRRRADAQNGLKTIELQMVELQRLMDAKAHDKRHIAEKLDAAKNSMLSKQNQLAQVKEMMTSLSEARVQRSSDLKYYKDKGEELLCVYREFELSVNKLQTELDSKMTECMDACGGERINVTRSEVDIGKEISAIEKQLQTEVPPVSNQEQLLAKCEELQTKYSECDFTLKQNDKLRDKFASALERRSQMWINLRDFLTERVTSRFQHHIKRRFNGVIQFDHAKGQIDIRMYTDERSLPNGQSNIDLKQMGDRESRSAVAFSGGEKSFATISLLLAIWDTMGCPIRCLDEFDVFMDSVNRTVAMNMLIEYAQKLQHPTQFIFVTPQNMNNVKATAGIRIHKLADPERNQTRLQYNE